MDAQEIKDRADLAAIVEGLTGHPGGGGMFHCPICGSGDGPNGTPALNIDQGRDPQHWHCFSCGNQGDVFDLAGHVYGLDTFAERKAKVMELAGLEDDGHRGRGASARQPRGPKATRQRSAAKIDAERRKLAEWRTRIEAPEAVAYLTGRGIDLEAAKALGLGYDPARRRITIPYPGSDCYHIDRAIDAQPSQGKYVKPSAKDVGSQPLWNPDALEGDTAIVVEGPMDAIALTLAGYGDVAVALGGTAYGHLVNALKARGYRGSLLVALDADDAGQAASEKLVAEALAMGMAAAPVEAGGLPIWEHLGVKDAADAWQAGPDALEEALAGAVPEARAKALEAAERGRREALDEALKAAHVVSATTAAQNVYLLAGMAEPQPTGMGALDEALGGGLAAGLYVLGATSSLGKTTLIGQVADNVAAMGRPVLFVTLEMSAEEMAAKSISRRMARDSGRRVGAWHLMRPAWRADARNGDIVAGPFRDACEAYAADVGDRLRYLVADAEPTVGDVAANAGAMGASYGQSPLVVIDYLQILKSPDGSLSDKQAVDRNVSALRRLARDLKAPVLCVASLNRQAYGGVVSMEAFKESGAIEYGSDVLMGLQPRGMAARVNAQRDEKAAKREGNAVVNEHKRAPMREVEITIIKNRWGGITGTDGGVALTYDAIANLFEEAS